MSDIESIRALSRAFVRELDLLDEPCQQCTVSDCHTLIELGIHDGLTVDQLGRHLGLEKSTVSRRIARLRRRGLIRTRPDSRDKRYKRIVLTRRGRDLVTRIHDDADHRVEQALALLDPDERTVVIDGFRTYVDALARSRLHGRARVRRIQRSDEVDLAFVIRTVMAEFDMVSEEFAYVDPEVDRMFREYRSAGHAYFVATIGGTVVGGAGVAPLRQGPPDVCELRKMYLLSAARGRGLGRKLFDRCLKEARRMGYLRCYLETMPQLETATAMYEANGFERLPGPLGDTGHPGCKNHYLRTL